MGWTVTWLSLVVFSGAAVAIIVAVGALRKRPDQLAVPLAVMMVTVAYWAAIDGISMGFADPDRVRFWYRLRYPGVVTAPVAYAVVANYYAGNDRWITRRTIALAAVIPVLTVAFVWTNSLHGFYWESIAVTTAYGASVIEVTPGPWYWVTLSYLYLLTFVTLSVLVGVVVRAGRMYRKQAAIMFVAGLLPLAMNATYALDVGPNAAVDLTATVLTGTGLLMALALFHFDIVEIRPVARDRLLEELEDGVVVVGPDGRIREYNPTAAAIFDGLEVDQPAEEQLGETVAPDGGELAVQTDDGRRLYRSRTTPLLDEHRGQSGHIVYLNDVTAVVEREQRLGVLNRILRHNVSNELNVALGHLGFLEEQATGETAEHVETARQSLGRVLTLAEKARDVERTLREADTTVTTSATAAVSHAVDAAESQYPTTNVTVEYAWDGATNEDGTVARDALVEVIGEELFEMALLELVENAVEHNDRERPAVTIRIAPADGVVRIQVADDGPPIEKQETAVLRSLQETGLEHGSGLGLWLVRWTVTLSSGDLTFQTGSSRGNVVTLTLPAGE